MIQALSAPPSGAAPSSCDTVTGNLVANCGFETGDFAGWTTAPLPGGHLGVNNDLPHSGGWQASFGSGPPGDTISQTIDTEPGRVYAFTFWLRNTTTDPGTSFTASVLNTADGDITELSLTDPPSDFAFHEFTYRFTAGTTDPTITFAGSNIPATWHVDDVAVVGEMSLCEAPDNLVRNCGFETTDPAWSVGAGVTAGQDASGTYPRSGGHWFSFGALTGTDNRLSQTILGTTYGATYRLSFFLQDTANTAEPDFLVSVLNATTSPNPVLALPNGSATAVPYAQHQATFIAGHSAPVLVFSGNHATGWYDLDDVTVTQIAPPPGGGGSAPPSGPTISVSSSKNPAVAADSLTFVASLTPVPSCDAVSWLLDDAPAAATTPGSGGTYTLGPLSGLAPGSHLVTAVFAGCAGVAPSTGSLRQQITASPSPSPTPPGTPTGHTAPTIRAQIRSVEPRLHGWYRSPVHVSFSCSPGSAPLASACPDGVTLDHDKPGGSVTAKVADTASGSASVTVGPIRIDLTPPTITVKRAGDRLRCIAADELSGLDSCVVTKHRTGSNGQVIVRWTATATDVAGNTAKRSGHYALH